MLYYLFVLHVSFYSIVFKKNCGLFLWQVLISALYSYTLKLCYVHVDQNYYLT